VDIKEFMLNIKWARRSRLQYIIPVWISTFWSENVPCMHWTE